MPVLTGGLSLPSSGRGRRSLGRRCSDAMEVDVVVGCSALVMLGIGGLQWSGCAMDLGVWAVLDGGGGVGWVGAREVLGNG